MPNLVKALTGAVLVSAILGSAACNTQKTASTIPPGDSNADEQQMATATNNSPAADSEQPANSGSLLGKLTSQNESVTLPAGTVLRVVIDQSLSSAENQSGDDFRASVSEPVVIDGKTVVPRGARIRGLVIEASPSGRLEHPGVLRLGLRSIELDGKSYELRTSAIEREGESHKKRDATLIGGGAGVGALIGAIAGHGKGAAIGALAGAGAGTAGAAATGKKDVSVPAETGLTFRLTQAVVIQVNG